MGLLVRRALIIGIIMSISSFASTKHVLAQLRVVSYNTATANTDFNVFTARSGADTVLEAIGSESVGGIAKPIDVLLLQEQHAMSTSTQSFVDILNDIYDPVNRTMYARSVVNGNASSDFFGGAGGRPGLVYNTQAVTLVSEVAVGTASGSAQARQSLRYQLRPVGYGAASDFYVYNDHYKAGSSSSDRDRRLIEAQAVRNNADSLGPGAHIIYAGDFNIQSSSEAMYGELLSAGDGQAFDPINTPGSWHDSSSLRITHTQSPVTSSQFGGQATGGVDDRFDFQLTSGEFLDDEGLSYLSGSYHAFGNNGSHSCCNNSITSGNGAAPNVLTALTTASDHLPVVADYQLPAILGAQLASFPVSVPLGASVSVDVFVENLANVLTSFGADELDYTINVSGSLFGSASGTNLALAGPSTHQITFDTSVEGLRSGVITVASSSQGAANSLINLPVSFSVGDVTQLPFQVHDNFDTSAGRISFSQSPLPGAFSSVADGFEAYQVGVSSSIPPGLVDETTSGLPNDPLGVVDASTKSDAWFGIIDMDNNDNPSGLGTATWEFDISGASSLEVSIDMAAMGDFEASPTSGDFYDWTYSIDDGPVMELFTSSVDEAGSAIYTLADGDEITFADPLSMTNIAGEVTQLSNVFQTITSALSGTGMTLTLELSARADGGDEAFAFDNIFINGITILAEDDADFDQDGDVDGADFLVWQRGLGTGTTLAEGDANNDGQVDDLDLAIWQDSYAGGAISAQNSATAVPEPSTWILAIGVFFALPSRAFVARQHPRCRA